MNFLREEKILKRKYFYFGECEILYRVNHKKIKMTKKYILSVLNFYVKRISPIFNNEKKLRHCVIKEVSIKFGIFCLSTTSYYQHFYK